MKSIFNFKNLTFKKALYFIIVFATLIYIFSIPSFGESSSFTRYFVYASLAILFVSSIVYIFLFARVCFTIEICFLLLFSIIALIGTSVFSHEFRGWLSIVLLFLSACVFYNSFKIIKNKFLIISIISLGFFLFSLYYIYIYRSEILQFSKYANDSFRLGSFFDNPNGVGAFAIVGLASSFYMLLFYEKKKRYFFILPLLTNLLVGITTGSRTFILIIAVFTFIFLYYKFHNKKRLFLIVSIGVVLTFVAFLFLPFMDTLRLRLLRALGTIFGTSEKVDGSTLSRTVWIDYGICLGSKNMLIGYGVDGFAIFSGVSTYSHSNFAELLCDFGILGFVVFYLPLILLLFKSFKIAKNNRVLVVSFVVYYLIVSFSSVYYHKKIYYLVFSLLLYLIYSEGLTAQKEIGVSKILFVCDTMRCGGAEKVISIIANKMNDIGIDVSIIGVGDYKNEPPFYRLNNKVSYIPIANAHKKRINPLFRILLLRKIIKNFKPDVVISFLPNANIYTSFSLFGLNTFHIVSERNNPYLNPKAFFARLFKKISFYLADGSVFQTENAKEYYSKSIQKKGIVIHNPIEVSYNGRIFKKRNNTIISVGRLTAQKNYRCLITAFELFHQKHPEYKLNIYGDGPLKEELLDLIKDKGLKKYVSLMGVSSFWQADAAGSSMFVSSSNYEGMPNALAEAIYLGIPCVGTDCPIGGTKELVVDGVNGYLCNVNDPVDLCLKMERAIGLSIQRSDIESFRLQHSTSVVCDIWLKYIKHVVEIELSK